MLSLGFCQGGCLGRSLSFCLVAGDSKVSATSPLSPSELLVALHQIEAKSDMKSVMKGNANSFLYIAVFN